MLKRFRSETNVPHKHSYTGSLPEVVEKGKFIDEYRLLCGELIELLSGDTQHEIAFKPTLAQIMVEEGMLKLIVCFSYPPVTPIRLHSLSDCVSMINKEYKPFISFSDGRLTVECHRPHQ